MKSVLISTLSLASAFAFTIDSQPSTSGSLIESPLSAIPWPYTTCQDDASWKVEGLTMGQTPKRNINDDITTTGTATKSVTFKRAEINVKLNGVFLDKQTAEFTDSFDSGDSITFSYKNFVPSFAPSGTYGLTFQFIDDKQKNNGCLQFTFKL